MNLSSINLTSFTNTRKPFQLILIAFLILTIYYPSFSAGWCSVDDITIIDRVKNIGLRDLDRIFVPGFKVGVYYRPITMLSFLLDGHIWNFDAFWMHAENVVLHVANAFLVFWLGCQLTWMTGRTKSFAPFLAAVLFALHPANSESVNWIAGRSDILTGFFVLLSANALLMAREIGSRSWMVTAGAVMVPGLLSKEVAIAYLPGAFAILICSNFIEKARPDDADGNGREVNVPRLIRYFLLATFIALAAFFLLRNFGIQKTEFRVGNSINRIMGDPAETLVVFLKALGFYFKKLFIPVPLNFGILDVDPLYFFLGLPAITLLFVVLKSRPMHGAFLVAGFFLISPAFIVAMGKFAWTSYAERYLYVASAFVLPAVTDLASQAVSRISRKRVTPLIRLATAICLLFFAVVVFHRSVIWTKDETLFRDTLDKSPEILSLRIDYAVLLADQGNINGAKQQMAVVHEKNRYKMENIIALTHENPDGLAADLLFAEAYILEKEGNIHESFMKYEQLLGSPARWSRPALERAAMLAVAAISRSDSPALNRNYKKKLKKLGQMLYDWRRDPKLLYIIGKTFSVRKDFVSAQYYFRLAGERFNRTSPYRKFTEKMLLNLKKEA